VKALCHSERSRRAAKCFFLLGAALALVGADKTLPGTWSTGPALPIARSEVAVATVDPFFLVIGGYAEGNVDQDLVQAYTAVLIASSVPVALGVVYGWRSLAPLPRGLNHVGAVGYGKRVYIFGGFSAQNDSPVADAYVYDTRTNEWSSIAPLPRALGSVSVAMLGDKIHLIGGRDLHSVTTHFVYDPATNHYSSAAPLPVGRDHMGLAAFGGRLYAIGGRVDVSAHNTSYVDIYDPRTNAWTSGAPMPTPRSGMAVAVLNGKIFAIGGEQQGMSSAFTTNEAYDPVSNSWTKYAPLPEGRHGTGAAVLNGRLYIPAGASVPGGTHQTNTLLIFSP
jgi:Kelch motif